ncbi:hypothetical protein [Planctomyces sp. SH-PL14]|uniref:hypothetical protein n=1 Tax=Planctomyces sp. SH-PL14 TaxID=1632864 RepID=UPI00078E8DD7|nr:hypothetical protein [Planctomyces sp. SH-PL14]AMV20542.1 hypothetical protein VT03_21770 [Planctomyces sp. SH-PL14]
MRPATRITLVVAVLLVLYVGSFLTFRAFPEEFTLAPPDHPERWLVVFSRHPEVHGMVRWFYWPLTQWAPGHRGYPTDTQLRNAIEFSNALREPRPVRPETPGRAP